VPDYVMQDWQLLRKHASGSRFVSWIYAMVAPRFHSPDEDLAPDRAQMPHHELLLICRLKRRSSLRSFGV
jgi:hypothetical protein